MKYFILITIITCLMGCGYSKEQPVDYTGHQVIAVIPRTESDVDSIKRLRNDFNVDLWQERVGRNASVMMRLNPQFASLVFQALTEAQMEYSVVFQDLQSVIDEEKRLAFAPSHPSQHATNFDFGKYNNFEQLQALLSSLASQYSSIAKLEKVGQSYENRPINAMRITSGGQFGTKPAIMMECGIHAREWTSVASGAYIINELITKYGSDATVTSLLDQYEFYIIPEANPDGYIYSYTYDRMWRKTRSQSPIDWMKICRGVDANRNFDIEHCGIGTSQKPCDDIFCGDKPFSESESRALRDLMVNIGSRMKAYFSIHAFSQLWMTPYGTTKALPTNYQELLRVGRAGADALSKRYGTRFDVGSIANIIYEAAGSSVDYAYVKHNIKMAFALELRDKGRRGFFLPPEQILPACEETFDGLVGAILALQ